MLILGTNCIPNHSLARHFGLKPDCYYEYHSQIALPAEGAKAVDDALRDQKLPDAVAAVKKFGNIGSNREPCEDVLNALYQVDEGESPAGVPTIRVVQEFSNSSGKPEYWFEVRLKMEMDEAVFDEVVADIAGGSLTKLRTTLGGSRVSRKVEFDKLLKALYLAGKFQATGGGKK